MIGVWNGMRALAGDALVAAGTKLSEQRGTFDEHQAAEFLAAGGRMESDGPDEPPAYVDSITDSELLRTAAHIISGWKPLLLRGAGTEYSVDELDEFIVLLRDRAAQFAALEVDDTDPQPSALLGAAQFFPQHRGK